MLEFTTKSIKPAVIKNSLNYLKCKKQDKYYLLKKFLALGCKKISIYAKMCFYFLMQVKMIIFIIRNRIFSNSIKIYMIRSIYAFLCIYMSGVDKGEKILDQGKNLVASFYF